MEKIISCEFNVGIALFCPPPLYLHLYYSEAANTWQISMYLPLSYIFARSVSPDKQSIRRSNRRLQMLYSYSAL